MPLSTAQNAWKNSFATAAARWNANLNDSQRQAWRAYAANQPRVGKLGEKYTPTGQNQHVGRNVVTYVYFDAWLDDPPNDHNVTQPESIAITAATSSPQALTIVATADYNPDECAIIYATPQTNVGFNNPARLWQPLLLKGENLPHTFNAIDVYTNQFKALVPGKKIWVMLRIARRTNGALSQGITTFALCT
jgi:hypothetical protein